MVFLLCLAVLTVDWSALVFLHVASHLLVEQIKLLHSIEGGVFRRAFQGGQIPMQKYLSNLDFCPTC